jgi:hypothetical protein
MTNFAARMRQADGVRGRFAMVYQNPGSKPPGNCPKLYGAASKRDLSPDLSSFIIRFKPLDKLVWLDRNS